MIASFIHHAREARRARSGKKRSACLRVKWTASRSASRIARCVEILSAIHGLPECRDLPIDDEPWKTILQVALRLGRRATASWDSSLRHGDFRRARLTVV